MQKVWTAKEVERIMLIAQGALSLNTPVIGEDDEIDTELMDFIEDPDADLEEQILRDARCAKVREILNSALSPRERSILQKRFGFDGEIMTLEEVGTEMHITRERVRQIEAKAMRKLQAYFRRKKLTEVDI